MYCKERPRNPAGLGNTSINKVLSLQTQRGDVGNVQLPCRDQAANTALSSVPRAARGHSGVGFVPSTTLSYPEGQGTE